MKKPSRRMAKFKNWPFACFGHSLVRTPDRPIHSYFEVSPELRKLAEELSESSLIMDYQFEILRKSFSNEIDTSTMLNLDNYSQSKTIHYLHLQERFLRFRTEIKVDTSPLGFPKNSVRNR